MKNLFLKKITVFIVIALIFIIGNFLGNFTIRQLFFEYKRKELEPLAKHLAFKYSHNLLDEDNSIYNSFIAVFDASGHDITPENIMKRQAKFDMTAAAKEFLPQIIAGKTISSMEDIQVVSGIMV